VFFNDATAPNFAYPGVWAFYRRPRGTDAATFRGQLVGVNPVEAEPVNTSDVGES
jgi:hypothetical protein